MFERKLGFRFVLLLFFLLGAFTASCAVQSPEIETTQPQKPITGQRKAEIDIKHIEVRSGEQIIFSGETTLSEDECINSQLFKDDNPVGWWPSDQCFSITSENWQFTVPLGEDSFPEELDDSAQYRLQVWWAGAPEETVDEIYFDLAGPQSP